MPRSTSRAAGERTRAPRQRDDSPSVEESVDEMVARVAAEAEAAGDFNVTLDEFGMMTT